MPNKWKEFLNSLGVGGGWKFFENLISGGWGGGGGGGGEKEETFADKATMIKN